MIIKVKNIKMVYYRLKIFFICKKYLILRNSIMSRKYKMYVKYVKNV